MSVGEDSRGLLTVYDRHCRLAGEEKVAVERMQAVAFAALILADASRCLYGLGYDLAAKDAERGGYRLPQRFLSIDERDTELVGQRTLDRYRYRSIFSSWGVGEPWILMHSPLLTSKLLPISSLLKSVPLMAVKEQVEFRSSRSTV